MCIRVNPLRSRSLSTDRPSPPLPHLPPNTGKEGKRWRQKEEHFQTADKAGRKKTQRGRKSARAEILTFAHNRKERKTCGGCCLLSACCFGGLVRRSVRRAVTQLSGTREKRIVFYGLLLWRKSKKVDFVSSAAPTVGLSEKEWRSLSSFPKAIIWKAR